MCAKTLVYAAPFILAASFFADLPAAPKLAVAQSTAGQATITVDATLHQGLGFSYPATYRFHIPAESHALAVYARHSSSAAWTRLPEKTSSDFFNGIEAVRFDYSAQAAFISVAFDFTSDDIFLKVEDDSRQAVPIEFQNICRYYDNRQAVVTITADDWKEFTNTDFVQAVHNLRANGLPVTVAIITGGCTANTWRTIQGELDSGGVEAASHTRSHLNPPYPDITSEITGSKQDILGNLILPAPFKKGSQGYVYTWIAPFGSTSTQIEAAVSQALYLIDRGTFPSSGGFSAWNASDRRYVMDGKSLELGPLNGGLTDIAALNSRFNAAVSAGAIYHLLIHPHDLAATNEWSKGYLQGHLGYIGNRTNVWYVNLGILYLYHFLQDAQTGNTDVISGLPAVNLLTNPGFETGSISPWTFYTNGKASVSLASPGSEGSKAGVISVTTEGTNVQLYQTGIALDPNVAYRLSFDAYSTSGHDMDVSLAQHVSPYTNYGLQSRTFDLSTSWKSFSVTFTTSGFSTGVRDGRLLFWLAPYDAAGDQYFIDNISLARASNPVQVQAPQITVQPLPQSVVPGQAATFSLTATGSAPLSYHWQRNNIDVTGATGVSYTTPVLALSDNGASYRCSVSNSAGSIMSASVLLTVTTAPQASTDILTNGNFESNTSGWTFFTNGAGACSAVTPGSSGSGHALQVTIATEGTNVQLFQQGLTLEPRSGYLLSFDAYSSTGHDVEVSLSKHVSPFTNYGLVSRKFDLTTTWQNFTVAFTSNGFSGSVPDGRLWFWLAPYDAAGDKFYFDNIHLTKTSGNADGAPVITTQPAAQTVAAGETATFSVGATGAATLAYQWLKNGTEITGARASSYITPATTSADNGAFFSCRVSNLAGSVTSQTAMLSVRTATGSNILSNGTFENGTAGWYFYTNGTGSCAAVSPGSSGNGNAGQVTITTQGTNVQLYQYGVTIQPNTGYLLSFDAWSNTGHDVEVSLGQHVAPYTNYGLSGQKFDLTTSWQSFSVKFTTRGFSTTVTDGRLFFWLAPTNAAGDRFYFDNVTLTTVPPASPAAEGREIKEQVAPFVPEAFALEGNFPNPFNLSTIIRYELPEPALITLVVHSILGQEVARLSDGYLPAGIYQISWEGRASSGAALSSGIYLCRMTATTGSGKTYVATKRMILMK